MISVITASAIDSRENKPNPKTNYKNIINLLDNQFKTLSKDFIKLLSIAKNANGPIELNKNYNIISPGFLWSSKSKVRISDTMINTIINSKSKDIKLLKSLLIGEESTGNHQVNNKLKNTFVILTDILSSFIRDYKNEIEDAISGKKKYFE
jgi:hypothetical protein